MEGGEEEQRERGGTEKLRCSSRNGKKKKNLNSRTKQNKK